MTPKQIALELQNKKFHALAWLGEKAASGNQHAQTLAVEIESLKYKCAEMEKFRSALKQIRDLDYRGNKHESYYIADRLIKGVK